jgi:hypothetical protein
VGENEELEGLDLEFDPNIPDKIAEEVADAIEEFEEPKERKIYKGKKNYRCLDYLAKQEPKHAAMLKMQIRGIIGWLEGDDKMSYKDVVMLPYGEFMDLLKQFTEANKIESNSF